MLYTRLRILSDGICPSGWIPCSKPLLAHRCVGKNHMWDQIHRNSVSVTYEEVYVNIETQGPFTTWIFTTEHRCTSQQPRWNHGSWWTFRREKNRLGRTHMWLQPSEMSNLLETIGANWPLFRSDCGSNIKNALPHNLYHRVYRKPTQVKLSAG